MNDELGFNVQSELQAMRRESQENAARISDHIDGTVEKLSVKVSVDHEKLVKKVDTALDKINDHEGRLIPLEGMRRSVRWLSATTVVAMLTGLVDYLVNHFHK